MKLSYFRDIKNIVGKIKSTKKKPFFVDRDPELFRHILNNLRDSRYILPPRCNNELDFWDPKYKKDYNIITTESKNLFRDNNYFYKNNLILNTIDKNPHSVCGLYGKSYDELPWTHSIIMDECIVKKIYILIPHYIPISELMYFFINIYIKDSDRTLYFMNSKLDFIKLTSNNEIKIISGFYYLPLDCFNKDTDIQLPKNIDLKIRISSKKYKKICTGIKYYRLNIYNKEKKHIIGKQVKLFGHMICSQIVNGECKLDNGYIRYILWRTEKKIKKIKLVDMDTGKKYVLTQDESQIIERTSRELNELPEYYGSMYFCQFPLNYKENSGGIFSSGKCYKLCFDPPTDGIICQNLFRMFTFDNNTISVSQVTC